MGVDLHIADVFTVPCDGADGGEHADELLCPRVGMGADDVPAEGLGVCALKVGEAGDGLPGFI